MCKSKPVELATQSFATQTQATAFFQAMLGRYTPGERVSETDFIDLAALLERHTEYKQKIGCGLDHFTVMMTEKRTPCFRIERTDKSGTDFSYDHCIKRKAPSRKQEVAAALRNAVQSTIYEARDKFIAEHKDASGLVPCAATGEWIQPEDAHMDHRPPMTFEVIVTTWLAGEGLEVDDVPISEGEDNQVTPEILDPDLIRSFQTYHNCVAQLDLVKKSVNLAQASQHRLKPTRINLAHP